MPSFLHHSRSTRGACSLNAGPLGVLVLPPVVGEGTIGGRCVELDAVEISTVSCAVVAVPSVTVLGTITLWLVDPVPLLSFGSYRTRADLPRLGR